MNGDEYGLKTPYYQSKASCSLRGKKFKKDNQESLIAGNAIQKSVMGTEFFKFLLKLGTVVRKVSTTDSHRQNFS